MATISNVFLESLIESLTDNTLRLEIELDSAKRMMYDALNKCERLTSENAKLKEEINLNEAEFSEIEKLRNELDRMRKWAKILEELSDKQLAECVKLHEAITNGSVR